MQVGSATSIIRVIKHSGNSSSCKSTSLLQDVKTSHVTSAFCFCSPCLHAYCSIFYQLLVFPGCQDISCDISFLLPLSSCSYCSIFYQLLVAYISHHQQQSPPQHHIHTTPPQNHESCIHRILLIMHNTIILLLPLFRQNLTKVECMQILQTNSH